MSGLNKIAYFAGILDGEGSFFMEQNQKNYKTPTIACEMTDEDVILSLRKFFKVGHVTKINPRKKHWKISYRWRVRNQPAVDILKEILKYLSIRRKAKAKFLIQEYKNVVKRN